MKSLAYFSPFLPQKSGISKYSHDLLIYLRNHYDITLVSDMDDVLEDLKVISFAEFEDAMNKKTFDRIIYNMGNHSILLNIYKCLLKYPGVVILHDFCIAHFISSLHGEYNNNDLLQHILKDYGLRGVVGYFFNDYMNFGAHYPLNRNLIENSKCVIAHTKRALELAKQIYNNESLLKLVPLARANANVDKRSAKRALNLENTRVYGVFGFVQPSKQNLEIISSWARVMRDKNAILLIVGEIAQNLKYYEERMLKILREHNVNNVRFIGWADNETYTQYLQACDVCISLRKKHLGEASAALLDAMNYENTVITNFSGFEEYSIYVPYIDENGSQLDSALLMAYECRNELAKFSKKLIERRHNPELCASKIAQITEEAYNSTKFIRCFKHRILIDITVIYLNDVRTGISRVVWQQLNAIIQSTNIPVYAIAYDYELKNYKFVNEFILRAHGVAIEDNEVQEVIPQNGDIFYQPDFVVMYGNYYEVAIYEAYKNGFFDRFKKAGGEVYVLIHDLLPLTHPEFFPFGAAQLHLTWAQTLKNIGANLVAISKRVADDLLSFGFENINVVHHGTHFNRTVNTTFKKNTSNQDKDCILTFLMVGTLEERKAQKAVALNFLRLQDEGVQARLIIIGHKGRVDNDFNEFLNFCQIDAKDLLIKLEEAKPSNETQTAKSKNLNKNSKLLSRLHNNPNTNIYFTSFASDDELAKLYFYCDALIAASIDEGFGLPLIEAASYGKSIIARDIAVFKEVAGQNALYFKDNLDLYNILKAVCQGRLKLKEPNQSTRTWKDCAKELLEVFGVNNE